MAQTKRHRPFSDLPPATQAGILCNDARFQAFAAQQCGLDIGRITPTAAAEYLRQTCGISSRRDRTSNRTANQKFQTVRTELDAWNGRIPSPHTQTNRKPNL